MEMERAAAERAAVGMWRRAGAKIKAAARGGDGGGVGVPSRWVAVVAGAASACSRLASASGRACSRDG